jgi:ribosomal-protein-alanine N-acetyltransferase
MPEIETARLLLRHFTLDDLDALFRLYSNPEIMRYVGKGAFATIEETKPRLIFMIEHWEKHGFGMWALVHKESGKMIGRCGLQYLDNTPEVELGYLLDKAFWNMGLATEASLESLKFGFLELGLERIVAIARPENIASQRVMQKVGMKSDKIGRFYNTDCVYYAILRGDYARN